jgi:hypothetical protein
MQVNRPIDPTKEDADGDGAECRDVRDTPKATKDVLLFHNSPCSIQHLFNTVAILTQPSSSFTQIISR